MRVTEAYETLLDTIRARYKYHYTEIAHRSGVSYVTLWAILTGRGNPRMSTIAKLENTIEELNKSPMQSYKTGGENEDVKSV